MARRIEEGAQLAARDDRVPSRPHQPQHQRVPRRVVTQERQHLIQILRIVPTRYARDLGRTVLLSVACEQRVGSGRESGR